jgi:type II secretion system protein G
MFGILTFNQRVSQSDVSEHNRVTQQQLLYRQQNGFTLIEIMVVVIIIGILAAIVAPNVIGRVDDARITAAKSDIATIEGALKLYRLDNFSFPETQHGLEALVTKPNDPTIRNWNSEGYIERLNRDPWGNPYLYLNPGTHGPIDIYSLGADGKPGGENNDADIGNWDAAE